MQHFFVGLVGQPVAATACRPMALTQLPHFNFIFCQIWVIWGRKWPISPMISRENVFRHRNSDE
jgi:hypothetical protein